MAVAELISPQEYLELERKGDVKHEYIDGQMIETAGASRIHNLIVNNIVFILLSQLFDSAIEVYSSDMRVRIPSTYLYTYPDIVVSGDAPSFDDSELDVLTNPTIIFEVLSQSTENRDRGIKFQNYRTIDSLSEYLLIRQDDYRIEHYIRQQSDHWLLSEATSMDDSIHLPSIDCDLPLRKIYNKVVMATNSSDMNGSNSSN